MTHAAADSTDVPPGYRESAAAGVRLVARVDHHDAVRDVLAHGPLHRWAAAQPDARALQGRGVAWATQLASGAEVVVRHSQHGGALARLTGDLFLAPSRAPRELATALRLADSGVPTPDVIAYATYPAFGAFCRTDVVTALVPGADLPDAWADAGAEHDAIVDAVAALLGAMQRAGAHHPDLNVKNILIAGPAPAPTAWVIDVDRVTFGARGSAAVAARNAERLVESLAKWRTLHGLDIGEAHIGRLRQAGL